MPEKIQYTNEQMTGDLLDIVLQAQQDDFTPHYIVGIARGGIIPATMLSHYYNVPLITLNLSLRDNKVEGVVDYATLRGHLLSDHKLLLVDDICDTGATFAMIEDNLRNLTARRVDVEHMNNLRSAVLWNNTAQEVYEPDYVGREINRTHDDRWVVFSYEEWWNA